MKSTKGKETCFYEYVNDKGIRVGFEISDENLLSRIRSSKRRSQYVYDTTVKYNYVVISYDYIETEDGESCGDEVIADDTSDFLEAIAYREDMLRLNSALEMLSDEEYELI